MRTLVFLCTGLLVLTQVVAQLNIYIPKGPSANPLPVASSYVQQIDDLIADMSARWGTYDSQCDPKAAFNLMYLHMTYGLRDHIRDMFFDNGELMSNFTVKFAHRYFQWLDADQNNNFCAPVWVDAFTYGKTLKSSVYEDLFLGMNAHINYDLGQIVYEMNYGAYKDDYDRINDILNEALGPITNDLAARYDSTLNNTVNTLLAPGVLDFIISWRDNAWINGNLLINSPLLRATTIEAMSVEAIALAAPYKSYNVAGLGASTAPARTAYCSAHHAPLSIN
jgi:hypothetical protein